MRRKSRVGRRDFPLVAVLTSLVAALASLPAIAWIVRFSPTADHARYWLARSDEGRLAALNALEKDPGPATVNVFGDAFLSGSLAGKRAEEWLFERLDPKTACAWDATARWSTWKGGVAGYRVRGFRSEDGNLRALSSFLKGDREYDGTRRRVIACP